MRENRNARGRTETHEGEQKRTREDKEEHKNIARMLLTLGLIRGILLAQTFVSHSHTRERI
jgi:hypothetical protein